jgi:iron(III) transport system ATP-binding protein
MEPLKGDAVRVEASHIELSYGPTRVLRDVSVTVEPGEFFALLGPSGSGKSTLLRLIAGFNRQQSGRLLIGGRDVTGVPPWKRNVGMVFQNYALWPHMSVARNVAFGLEERRLPRDEIRRKVGAALDLVGLTGYGERRPNQLSGGQQQRVALARTLAVEPHVLLLDEPLSNLDAKLRVQMRRELRRVHDQLGITTIFVTHDQEEAMTICDRIAVLDEGVVQQVGSPIELYDRPANRFVAQFVGSVNLFRGTVRREGAAALFRSEALGEVALPASLRVTEAAELEIAFRPHVVELEPAGAAARADAVQLVGTVEGGEFLGEFMRYEIRVGSATVIADRPHAWGGERLAPGSPVALSVASREVRVIQGPSRG